MAADDTSHAGSDGPPNEWFTLRRYFVELFCAGGVTLALLAVSFFFFDSLSGFARVAVDVAPLAGFIAMALAFARLTLYLNERGRGVILASGAVAALACCVVTQGLSLFEDVGGPHVRMSLVMPLIVVSAVIASPFVVARYR